MIYLAVTSFTDTQDKGYKYHTGDKYPRAGYQPTAKRIDELLTDKNRRHTPMIKAEEEETPKKVEAPKADANPTEKPAVEPAKVTDKKEVEKPKAKKTAGRPRKK